MYQQANWQRYRLGWQSKPFLIQLFFHGAQKNWAAAQLEASPTADRHSWCWKVLHTPPEEKVRIGLVPDMNSMSYSNGLPANTPIGTVMGVINHPLSGMPLILALGRLTQVISVIPRPVYTTQQIPGQQGYIARPCLKKERKKILAEQ